MSDDQAQAPKKLIDPKALLGNFPFKPRGNQPWVLERIAEEIAKPNIRYIVVEAPTGSGKSALAMSITRSADDGYILTSNKDLQNQYLQDFKQYLKDLRGKANYQCCNYPDKTRSKSCLASTDQVKCEYHQTLLKAIEASITSMNYMAGLCFLNYTPFFENRAVLVCDEAHNLESQITSFVEFNFSEDYINGKDKNGFPIIRDGEEIPIFETVQEYLPWLRLLDERTGEFERMNSWSEEDDDFQYFKKKLKFIRSEITNRPDNFVVTHKRKNAMAIKINGVGFKPIDISDYARDRLFKFADKVIFLSATIGSYQGFISNLGIDPSEAVFIEVPSTFPKENRPINRDYVGYLNKDNLMSKVPEIVAKLEQIAAKHANEKGIVFCPSYQLCTAVYEALPLKLKMRFIYPQNSQEKFMSILKHAKDPGPTILLSPSMTEGVDLKDDLSRWAVLCKIPYPNMGDPIVKARIGRDRKWSDREVIKTISQSYGRSVRSEKDWATFYILDECFERILNTNRGQISIYLTEAIEGYTPGRAQPGMQDTMAFLKKLREGK